ncbi:MAG: hypothetical protein CMB99_15685 [Flavobacteriaceae bacterium]|nr:hypothetical protein [Flavobacteriaceae bacterium]
MVFTAGYSGFTACKEATMSKSELREFINKVVAEYLENGGEITVCPARVAQGAGFRRNKSPFNNLGAEIPSIYVR